MSAKSAPDLVEKAIDETRELLAEGRVGWFECETRAYDRALMWESIIITSSVPKGRSIERNGHTLIRDASATGRPGRRSYANHLRDWSIAEAVLENVKEGFRPTRNPASKQASACCIVKLALERIGVHLSEKAVERIWAKFASEFKEELAS
jgi:hypothetical protein